MWGTILSTRRFRVIFEGEIVHIVAGQIANTDVESMCQVVKSLFEILILNIVNVELGIDILLVIVIKIFTFLQIISSAGGHIEREHIQQSECLWATLRTVTDQIVQNREAKHFSKWENQTMIITNSGCEMNSKKNQFVFAEIFSRFLEKLDIIIVVASPECLHTSLSILDRSVPEEDFDLFAQLLPKSKISGGKQFAKCLTLPILSGNLVWKILNKPAKRNQQIIVQSYSRFAKSYLNFPSNSYRLGGIALCTFFPVFMANMFSL